MSKITLALAFGAGYVVGARAGRERYEQIRAGAQKVASNPTVQAATDTAKEKAVDAASSLAETAKEKAGDVALTVVGKVKEETDAGTSISAAP